MNCQACGSLLSAYERAVSLYTTSVSDIKTQYADDFRVACRERQKAWMARETLTEHWRLAHEGLTRKLVSHRAKELTRVYRDADDALMCLCIFHALGGRFESNLMVCKTCHDLLAAYKEAVSLYQTAVWKNSALAIGHFMLAFKQTKRLRKACRDANDAFMKHWSQHYSDPGHKAASA